MEYMNSKEALKSWFNVISTNDKIRWEEHYKVIKKDLEVLEQLETLKKYYPPFKKFLEEMFEKGYNEDLKKLKEWLENE